eukprot:gene11041-18645_t
MSERFLASSIVASWRSAARSHNELMHVQLFFNRRRTFKSTKYGSEISKVQINVAGSKIIPPVAVRRWGVVAGRTWDLLECIDQGQTQLDQAYDGEMVVWAHPLDVHYSCKGLAGWPKLHFQVWSQRIWTQ